MGLLIKKNDYGLRIYCTKCKKQYNYHNAICNHSEHQHYKSLVSNGSKRRTKSHPTKNYDEALRAAIQFKSDVKNGVVNDIHISPDPNYISIISAANMFLAFKNGDEVPMHLKKDISKNHLADIKRNIQQFINILRTNNVDVDNTNICELNDQHVGYWYEHTVNNYSEGSFATKLKIMKSFINYLIDEIQVKMRNPFKKVRFNTVVYDTSSITEREFLAVLDAVENKMEYQQLGGKRKEVKNNYRPYLINGFKLALYTGLRREELVTLSWNDLYHSEKNKCLMFVIDNLKVERITGRKFKKKFIPIGPDLKNLLIELGYQDLKGSNLFILEPNRTVKHTTIMAALSRGFTHFYKQAFPEVNPKSFKILRKTYLTYLNKTAGDDTITLSSHGSMKTLKAHYLDQEVIAKGLTMKIF